MKRLLIFKSNCYGRLRLPIVVLLYAFFMNVDIATANVFTGSQTMHATSAETAKGLVYANNNQSANPTISNYTTPSAAEKINSNGTEGMAFASYVWAMPARGYKFTAWEKNTNGNTAPEGETYNPLAPTTNTGSGDKVTTTVPRMQTHHGWTMAKFGANPNAYNVVYIQPVGGSYSVTYSYKIVNESTKKFTNDSQTLSLSPSSGDMSPTDPRDETDHKTYDTDEITLSSSSPNFIAWYVNGILLSTDNPYTGYRATDDATISAEFKELAWGEATGDLTTNVTTTGEHGDKTVYVAIPTMTGTWTAADFTVTPMNTSNSYGSIVIGSISVDAVNSRLVIPYTYTATTWGNVSADITITPVYGATEQFSIACSAEEVIDYEACIEESGVRTNTGTLAAMMTQANTMTNKPTVKLMNPVTITAPLSFTKSMTFDVNGKVLTASCASAFSIDAASIDVKIIDGSFTQVGEIHTSYSSTNPVSVVTFTQAAKLTMQGGTLSANNTGSGSAYGIDVKNGSTFYMTNGQLTVTASSGNAEGVHVATASDYATLNGGSVTVSVPSNAYGLWSAGQSNITNATINVETTGGANAYGVYINGGVSTLTTNTITATAKTTGAYGAYVNAGRLNGNGGSFTAEAVTSDVYGVHVAAGATAMLQMNAVVTAEATGASGTSVFGVNNLGTVSLSNITVTATSPTNNATAVNSATSAVSTTIEGGTYTANVETGTVYGLHHQYGTLTVDGGTFKGILKTSGSNAYGARFAADGTVSNATILGETRGTGATAYGVVGGVANKNITLTNCTITGQSNTSKAYAIYSRANVTATSCMLTATTLGANYACGFYAENGTNSSVNTNAIVSSYTNQAYGVYHAAGSLSVNAGTYNVEAKQTTASASQNSELYGIYNAASQTTNVNGASFNVNATNTSFSQNVFGAYINGTLNSANGEYIARGKTTVYGIYGLGSSRLTLTGNNVESTVVNGTASYGIYAKKNFTIDGDIVNAIGNSKGIYALFFDASNSLGDVLSGKFGAQGNGTNDYGPLNASGTAGNVRLKGGVYNSTNNLQKYAYTGYQVYHLDGTHPDYVAGYRYTIATENPSPYVCRIVGGAYYSTLEEALQYTKDNSGNYTIVMTQHYTLPAGNYELPSNATLLIPYKFDQSTIAGATPNRRNTVGLRENFLTLTFAAGANLNVAGKIEVGGEMYCQESGQVCYNNSPYGRIHLNSGSLIQLNGGAYLYAWGYITGTGEIKVKNNAEVHEMFQIGDQKTIGDLYDDYVGNTSKFFPIQQYFIQNIEAPTTYYYNSRLITAMYIYYKGTSNYHGGNNIKLVGTSGALFQVIGGDESSWVRKSYDAVHDYQVWEVNSSVELGSISLSIGGIPYMGTISLKSSDYILPVASNMKIKVKDGNFSITQDSQLLPGSSIEVDKTASVKVNSNVKLYVFDKDQYNLTTSTSTAFSPGWTNGTKPSRTVNDAAINVHGNINVLGKFYTSKSLEGGTNATYGANIFSNNADAGTVQYSAATGSATATVTLMTSATATKSVTMNLADLKNGDGTFTSTSSTSAGRAYAYINNVWQQTYTNGCFEVIGETVYAKPSEYVALKKSQTVDDKLTGVEETNHTYLTAEDKILILMDECQWWEVEKTPDDPTVFKCKKEGYEGFYYYNTSTNKWELKTVDVKFYKNETGETVLKTITTSYNGIPDQAVIATNPTKETTAAATYAFYGWKSSVTGTEYKWTDPLEVATADMSYRPVFTETPRNYTITLVDANNGANVPLEVAYGTTPSYEPVKDATAQYTYTFEGWSPAFTTVTGTATYTANWNSVVNEYNITWMNGETVLEVDENQPYGTVTSYGGATPTKAADDDYAYTFSGWHNSLTNAPKANNETVTSEITYTAQYNTTPRYAVTFNNYDGTQLARPIYTQGETPAYGGVPTRKRDDNGYFKFIGWKNSNGTDYAANATLPAVTKKETYTAQYDYVTDLFTITLNNVDGAGATWSGKFGVGSIPFYNPNDDDVPVTPTKTGNVQYTYVFSSWSPAMIPVDGEATYTAVFSPVENKYTVSVAAGANGAVSLASVSEIGCETASADITATPDAGYTFSGWTLPDGVTAATGYTVASNPIRIHAIAADKTVTANFTANTNTAYTVEHYKQQLDGTYASTPDETDNMTGTTATETAAEAYTYTGFEAQAFSQGTIAGEGTTVVKIYYTRLSYTLTWTTDGDALTGDYTHGNTLYEAAITAPATPTKTGYTFANWTPDVAATMPAAATEYTATWTANTNTPYTVKHWQQNIADDDYTEVTDDQQSLQGTTAAATAAAAKTYTGFTAQAFEQGTIAADGSTVVNIYYNRNLFTITWKNADNTTLETDVNVRYGATPVYNGATPTKPNDGTYNYAFREWSPEIGSVTDDATYTAQFAAVFPDLDVATAYDLPMTATNTNTIIRETGELTIPDGMVLTTTNLILKGTTTTSGQVFADEDKLNVTNAYYDLTLNAQTRTWYGVGVPWRVDPWTGIYGGADSEHLTKLRLGKDFDIIWYNGRVRAASGPVSLCYEYLEKYGDNPELRDVVPGRMYFMFFARPYNVIRFEKKAGAALVNEGSVTTERYTGAADETNHGWNGIANPGLTHVTIPYATPDMGYRYKRVSIDNKGVSQWEKVFNLHTETFVVGQPIMVQLPQDGPFNLGMVRRTTASSAPLRKMTVNGDIDRAEVVMTSSTGLTDRILCVVDDEARDEYTIGADLVMFPNSEELPQLWINNYKHALAVNTVRLENSVATYPLTIVSPKAGDYTLSLANKMADGIHVYLTLNGEAIADLTEGEYVLTMGKETSKAYGIRLVRGPRGTVTSIDEALEGKENVEKVVKDGVLYIIRQGNVYDASGRKVE